MPVGPMVTITVWVLIVVAILVFAALIGLGVTGAYFANQASTSFTTGLNSVLSPNPWYGTWSSLWVPRAAVNLPLGTTCPTGTNLLTLANNTGVCTTCPSSATAKNAMCIDSSGAMVTATVLATIGATSSNTSALT